MSTFASLEQRMVNTFLDTFPPFVPHPDKDETAQRRFYGFIKAVYISLFDNPQLLFPTLNEDDVYTYRFNRAADKKPKLHICMKSAVEKIKKFLLFLQTMGKEGVLSGQELVCVYLKRQTKYYGLIEKCGVSFHIDNDKIYLHGEENFLTFWKDFAAECGEDLVRFSRCMFDLSHNYLAGIFSNLFGNKTEYERLEQYLIENGYFPHCRALEDIALDYTKNYAKKETPLKAAWAERNHAGVSMIYSIHVEKHAALFLRMPHHKEFLEKFSSLDEKLKDFVVKSNKKCDGCGYCMMNRNTPNTVIVNHDKTYAMCYMFPGFYFGFAKLDKQEVDIIIKYLSTVHEFFKDKAD